MAGNVIYLPKEPSFGEALGSGVSQGASQYVTREMEIQQKQRLFQQNMQGLNALKNAGTREKALEILASGNIPFQNAQEMSNAFRFVDELYPVKDTTAHKVTAYDSEGNATEKYVPGGRLTELNDPSKAAELLGPGVSLTKPEPKIPLYTDVGNGVFTASRRGTLGTRKPGEYTMDEINALHKSKADDRAAQAAERSATAAEQSARRENRNAETQEISTTMAMVRNASAQLANALNLKHSIGIDGLVSLDADANADKARVFNKAQPLLLDAMRRHKGDTGKAVSEVLEKVNYQFPDEKKQEPVVAKKESGFVESIVSRFTGKKPDNKKAEAKPTEFNSDTDVKAAMHAGKISREEALKILRTKFGYK